MTAYDRIVTEQENTEHKLAWVGELVWILAVIAVLGGIMWVAA